MLFINNIEKLTNFKKSSSFFVIMDFDRTLTTDKSNSSMGIIPMFLGGKILSERIKIYKHYRPLEIDYTINEKEKKYIMRNWTIESFTLLSKYLDSEEMMENSLKDANIYLRDGAREFLRYMYESNIPVIIMSAGLGNLIEMFLRKEKILYDNIILISNFFTIDNNKAYIDTKSLISPSSKDYSRIPKEIRDELNKKDNILLCGDIVEDIKMVKDNQKDKTLTIGFLNDNTGNNLEIYNTNFDIVLTNEGSFNTIKEILTEDKK